MSKRVRAKPPPSSIDVAFWGVSLCFLLSGVAGLVYQMVWMRYLSTVFGTSELAIVTVLVAYMGGLAMGAWIASKRVHFLRSPIRVYAILEGVIAASALLVPLLLRGVGGLHRLLLGGQDSPPADGGVVEALAFLGLGCVVLLIPTACMGATLPILAAGVIRRSAQIGRRVGWLYALNTLGAVAGTILAAFVLIPSLGLWQTSFVGVALNLTVAVLGWWVALRTPVPADAKEGKATAETEPSISQPPRRSFAFLILGVMLVSGGLSFAYEVLWARLLSHLLGGSLYAFATMLAAFLAGIAIGGLAGAALAKNHRRSCLWLAGVEIATGVLSAVIFLSVSSATFGSGERSLGALAVLCGSILMPATVCIGATFPLAVRSLTEDHREAGRSAGRVYAWNTIGAIVGAVGAGYFLIPALGFADTFKWAIVGNLFLGTLVLFVTSPRPTVPAAIAAVLTVGFLGFFHPKPPLNLLTMSPFGGEPSSSRAEPELIHHAVGHSATVAVLKRRGSFLLRTNGLPEAEVFGKGADKLSYTRIRWLPALPKVLRPATSSMLVVGFGGGALLEAVPRGIETIDVVELEAEVIRANQLIADRRAIDPFQDERINVVVNDVRGALRLTSKRYDAIVSQPSHPWTAGASHLYTREFLELARDHLTEDGIFVQWLGAHFVDEDLLRSFTATILAVFPHAQLYLVGDNFVFAGSAASIEERFLEGAGKGGSLLHLSDYPKLSFVEDVLAVLQLDEEGCRQLAGGRQPITDNRNLMATHQGLGGQAKGGMTDPENLRGVIAPLHYLNQEGPALLKTPAAESVQYPYLLRLLAAAGPRLVDLERFRNRIVPLPDRLASRARVTMNRDPEAALDLLRQATAADPDHPEARALEVQIRLTEARRRWVSRGLGPAPLEFADLVAGDGLLLTALDALSPERRAVLEAEHWMLTNQVPRARAMEEKLAAFDDHRDPFFQIAGQVRVRFLLDPRRKSEAEAEQDARRGAELLDQLLALPLVTNLSLASQRIALAQHFGDTDYQIASGWIMARRIASAPPDTPEKMKEVYRTPLRTIFQRYSSRDPRGRLEFSDEAIGEFHRELVKQIGVGVLPEEFRP